MRKKSKFLYITLLLPTALFFRAYNSVPSDIHLTENSEYVLKSNALCNISDEALAACESSNALISQSASGLVLNTENSGNYKLKVKMLNFIPVKTVNVTVSPEKSVIVSGSPVGIKLYSDGLLIINIADVTAADGTTFSPAKAAGLSVGDRIVSINGKTVNTSEEFSVIVNSSDSPAILGVVHKGKLSEITITPRLDSDGRKKIGIWVRDSTAGVGTLTFYDPESSSFAALGHAITDIDTGDIVLPKSGSISDCQIASATKSISGSPGELSGVFSSNTLGDILLNSQLGIYGKSASSDAFSGSLMPCATRFQVKLGSAYIMSDIDGGGVKKYSIEIEEISQNDTIDNKGMVIRITDPVLLEKTGGIVQGMSGSPIIQNERLVGAVTHVFVNEPERGYGIFAEFMLAEAEALG